MIEPELKWIVEDKRRIGSVRRHQYRTAGDSWLATIGVGVNKKPRASGAVNLVWLLRWQRRSPPF